MSSNEGRKLLKYRTSSNSRKFNQSEDSIVTRYWFERDIWMPTLFATLLLLTRVEEDIFVDLLRLDRTDDAYFIIITTKLTRRIRHWVDV